MDKRDSKKQAECGFKQETKKINPDDVKNAVHIGRRKVNSFGDVPPSALHNMWEEIKLMVALIRDYVRGDYREVPWTTIAACTAAIIYFVNPFDIIPDFIPVLGYLDDAAVLGLALKLIRDDLSRYRSWREKSEFIKIDPDNIEDADFEEIENDIG